MFKEKKYYLCVIMQEEGKSYAISRHCGLKKIDYIYDKVNKTVKATLTYDNGKQKVVEYTNVIEVEKGEV